MVKKFSAFLVLFGVLGFSAFSQTGRATRPRIVGNPASQSTKENAQILQSEAAGDASTETSVSVQDGRKPPVLIGRAENKEKERSAPVLTGGGRENQSPAGEPAEAPPDAGEDDEVIRIETSLVMIPVSVLDRNGRFIPGLRQQDFRVFEDGKEQKIEYFAPVEQAFTVVLLLDVSNSTSFKIDEIQNAAIAFTNQLKREDKVMVIAFDDTVKVLAEPTSDRRFLQNAIRQTQFGGGTSLYDAMTFAMERLNRIDGRKAVVLFTDGVDTTSRKSNYQSTIRSSQELDAMIYPIRYDTFSDMNAGGAPNRGGGNSGGLLGKIIVGVLGGGNINIGGNNPGTSRDAYKKGAAYLEDLARNSGGRLFQAQNYNNLENAFSGIADELRQQYSIGYYPEVVGEKGQRKQIKVSVNRPGLAVRTRTSYTVGEDQKKLDLKRLVE